MIPTIKEHERKYLNDILKYRIEHSAVMVELEIIGQWKHLDYCFITMAGEMDNTQRRKHGNYKHLTMESDYDLLMLRDRYLPIEQCISDIIDGSMFPRR